MERTFIYCLVIIFFGTVAPKQISLNRRQIRLMQLVETVEKLQTCVNDTDPALLSTPENVEKHCEESALKCFQEAPLKPLNNEEKKMRCDVLIKQLRRKLPQREARKTNPKCPSCDSFKKKPHKEFFKNLRSLLQKMISHDHHHH